MAKIISASIDLTKIDKTKIVEKDGRKWYNITISVNDEKDKYDNDTSISTNQSKEEREAKAPKVYLGNGKTVWTNEAKKDTIADAEKELKAEGKVTADTMDNAGDLTLPF